MIYKTKNPKSHDITGCNNWLCRLVVVILCIIGSFYSLKAQGDIDVSVEILPPYPGSLIISGD